MNIFEALRQSHEIQRSLTSRVSDTSGDTPLRRELFNTLKIELTAHSLAEERHFYVPIMETDMGIDIARHAIAEHHEMDEMVEQLEETQPDSSAWLPLAKKLADKVHHHLEEEEHGFFQLAGKILNEKQKTALADDYLKTYENAKRSAEPA